MADYTSWTEKVYALRLPTNAVEISKVISAITQYPVQAKYDDSITVEAVDLTGEGDFELRFRGRIQVPQ